MSDMHRLRRELAKLREDATVLLEQQVKHERAQGQPDLSFLTVDELVQLRDIQGRQRAGQLSEEDRAVAAALLRSALTRSAAAKVQK